MGWINTFYYNEGNNVISYRTNGTITVTITDKESNEQTHYSIKISKDGKSGMDFVNEIIKKHKGELANNPEQFMKYFGDDWKKGVLL